MRKGTNIVAWTILIKLVDIRDQVIEFEQLNPQEKSDLSTKSHSILALAVLAMLEDLV